MSVSEALQVTSLKGRAAQFQHLATIDIYDLLGETHFYHPGKKNKNLFRSFFSPLFCRLKFKSCVHSVLFGL